MSLVLPREEEVEDIFSRILSSDRSGERLVETFYNHLCDDEPYLSSLMACVGTADNTSDIVHDMAGFLGKIVYNVYQ